MTIRLDNVRIVMVNTSHPGNIGAAARAMKNMCLSDMVLVKPVDYSDGRARARASGAIDVLTSAREFDDLRSAIEDCELVVGASARLRSIPWPQLNPREMAEKIITLPVGTNIALVFGNEASGLSNEEMDLCHYLVHIPANPDYTSLNISAAIQVLCYEMQMTALLKQEDLPQTKNDYPGATAEELELFYEHLEETLKKLGFLHPKAPRLLMRRLRRLYNRAELDKMELNILRGILTATNSAQMDKNA